MQLDLKIYLNIESQNNSIYCCPRLRRKKKNNIFAFQSFLNSSPKVILLLSITRVHDSHYLLTHCL